MRKYIIANWKMHYGPIKAGAWIRAFRRERLPKDLDIGVAIPHISFAAARSSLGRASVPWLGAQNVCWAEEGAYTGETSPGMLQELGSTFCIVGHSERRLLLGETDEMISKKVAALVHQKIQPIICIGETEVQRKKGEASKIVRAQLTSALSGLKSAQGVDIVIAYEPVWAIGSGKPCEPNDARQMHEVARDVLKKKFGKDGETMRVIYGGSVDVRTVHEYVSTTAIDGVLVGGASLDPRAFGLVCRAASPA